MINDKNRSFAAKNVALNDFFHVLKHLFHPTCINSNTFAADIIVKTKVLTKNAMQMKQKKRFILSFSMLLLSTIMYAQEFITGTVVDAAGEPIIGATVM